MAHSLGAEITTGYPEFDHILLKKLGWWDDLTEAEKKAQKVKTGKLTCLAVFSVVMKVHGCHPSVMRKHVRSSGISRSCSSAS
jgi:formate dehydrogenase major subunit